MNLTRRNFIKYAGGSAGAMMITSAIPMPAWAADAPGNAILTAGRWGRCTSTLKTANCVVARCAGENDSQRSANYRTRSGAYPVPYSISDGA